MRRDTSAISVYFVLNKKKTKKQKKRVCQLYPITCGYCNHFSVLFLFLSHITAEIERLLSGGSVKDSSVNGSSCSASAAGGSKRFCDVTKDKPIKVTIRTSVPTRDHPKVRRKKNRRKLWIFLFFFFAPIVSVSITIRDEDITRVHTSFKTKNKIIIIIIIKNILKLLTDNKKRRLERESFFFFLWCRKHLTDLRRSNILLICFVCCFPTFTCFVW